MSKLTYNLGHALGTALREFLLAIQQANRSRPETDRAKLPPVFLSEDLGREVDHVPAMVRVKGIDLNAWYRENLHEFEQRPCGPHHEANTHPQTHTEVKQNP